MRGSVGNGLQSAAHAGHLRGDQSSGAPTFIDHVACNAEKAAGGDTSSCKPAQYPVTSERKCGQRRKIVGFVQRRARCLNRTRASISGADVFLARIKNVVGIDYADVTRKLRAGDAISRPVE